MLLVDSDFIDHQHVQLIKAVFEMTIPETAY